MRNVFLNVLITMRFSHYIETFEKTCNLANSAEKAALNWIHEMTGPGSLLDHICSRWDSGLRESVVSAGWSFLKFHNLSVLVGSGIIAGVLIIPFYQNDFWLIS